MIYLKYIRKVDDKKVQYNKMKIFLYFYVEIFGSMEKK